MTALVAMFLICLLIFAPRLCAIVATMQDDASAYDDHGERFFASSRPLFEDPETPIEIMKMHRVLGRCIIDRRGPQLVYHVFSNPKKMLEVTDEERRIRKVIQEFLAKRPVLSECHSEAIWHGLLAVSYRRAFYGGLIRQKLIGIETNERKQDVVFAIPESGSEDCWDDGSRLAAA